MKDQIFRKISSRKFWCGMVAYITSILTAFNISDNTIVQVTSILGGIGALAVYMLAEAYVDGKREENADVETEITIEEDNE